MREKLIVPWALLTGVLLMASPAFASPYTFQTLNNPGDPAFNQLLGINNSGVIAGYFGDGTIQPNKGYTLSPPYTVGNYTNENFPASVQTQVVGINAGGTTVGFYIDAAGNNFGFVKNGGTFTSVQNPATPVGTSVNQLLGINQNGLAAGFYTDAMGNDHGYLYNTTGMTFTAINLPSGFNAVSTVATGVDNGGVVSGFFTDAGGFMHGFTDNAGTFTQIDDPSGTNTMALGLNNNQLLVGSYVNLFGETEGFVDNLATDTFQTISDPFSSATGAFMVTGTTVNGINDLGQLVGFYSDGTNVDGFLATLPTPEAPTWILLATGTLGLAGTLRRRVRMP